MEIFGLRKTFCFNYTRFTYNENYFFLFENEPTLDLEVATYLQLMQQCDALFLLKVGLTPDCNNVAVSNSLFIPKKSTQRIRSQPASVQTAGGNLTVLADHLAYAPESTDNGDVVASMTWFEGSSYKTSDEYSAWQSLSVAVNLTPIVYSFDRMISVNCFVIRQTASVRPIKIEAWVNGEWQTVSTFTPLNNTALNAIVFSDVVSDKFRLTFNASYTITGLVCAYFGKLNYDESDETILNLNFTKAVLCPSTKVGGQLRQFTTSSTVQNDGFDVEAIPLMLLSVSTSGIGDVTISGQVTTEPHLGRFVIGGYLV